MEVPLQVASVPSLTRIANVDDLEISLDILESKIEELQTWNISKIQLESSMH
jgi:hypothetical protein